MVEEDTVDTASVRYPAQRVAVFIDVQNMYHSARSLYNARVNFKEILNEAISGRKLLRAFAYVVRTKTGEEKPFFDALQKQGIEIRVRDLQEFLRRREKSGLGRGYCYRRHSHIGDRGYRGNCKWRRRLYSIGGALKKPRSPSRGNGIR